MKFTYTTYKEKVWLTDLDNNKYPVTKPRVIFECEANSLLEADKLLFEKTGVVAVKENFICCGII